MSAVGSIAEEVATLEQERDDLLEALTDLVASVKETEHVPHDGKRICLRCRADRIAEEHAL